jgi:hypothetical protein
LFAISPSIEKKRQKLPLPTTKKPHAYEKNTLHLPNIVGKLFGKLPEEHLKIPLGGKILLRSWNEPHAPTTGTVLNWSGYPLIVMV